MTDKTVHAALAAVMEDCRAVAKRDENTHQRFMFRGIDAVVNAVGPILRKHAVIVVPQVREVSYDQVTTTNNKPATACRVLVTYTFYGPDGSSLDATVAAEAWDHGDKAAPKAMSVAFRTALLQSLALPTDERDPDSHTYEQAAPPSPAEQLRIEVAAAANAAGVSLQDIADRWRSDYDHNIGDTNDLEALTALRDDLRARADKKDPS